jgi:hypothetical protein
MKSKTKKTSARKTSKAATAKARASVFTAARPSIEAIKDTAALRWVGGENPRRKGSGPHDIYEVMRKSKTVAAFTSHEGCGKRWIAGAVARGLVKLG